jgi:hypothetical protein
MIKHVHILMSMASVAVLLGACGGAGDPADVEERTGEASDALISTSWTALTPPPGFTGSPGACSIYPGIIHVVAVGQNQNVFHTVYRKNQGFSPWENLGGQMEGDPSCTAWDWGEVHVFGRGSFAFDVLHKGFTGATWDSGSRSYVGGSWAANWDSLGGPTYAGSWSQLNGTMLSAVGAPKSGYPGVIGIGWDNQLWMRQMSGDHVWGSWMPLGGTFFAQPPNAWFPTYTDHHPALATFLPGSTSNFSAWGQSTNGRLYYEETVPNWVDTGTYLGTDGIDAVEDVDYAAHMIHVAVRGADKVVYVRFQSHNTVPVADGWHSLGGQIKEAPAIVMYRDTYADALAQEVVFAHGLDDQIYYRGYQLDYRGAPVAPRVQSFTVSPQSTDAQHAYVTYGQSVTLSWAITMPQFCGGMTVDITGTDYVKQTFHDVEPGAVWGSVNVKPTATTNKYTITATCAYGGTSQPAYVYVNTYAPPPHCTTECFKVVNSVNCFEEAWCVADGVDGLAAEQNANPGATVTQKDCSTFGQNCP